MERELRSPDFEMDGPQHLANCVDESRTVTPCGDEPEVIHGVDPALLSNDDTPISGQEMQERSGMPMLSSRAGDQSATTIDRMDLDQVVEDDNLTEASPAVQHVDLT